jgi:drug/metabolite transporter (DMT)-like permease
MCHATWNYFVKRINGGAELVWLFSVLSVVLYLPIALYVLVTEAPKFGSTQLLFIVGSAGLHLGYFLLLQRGYRSGDLSLVYPTARATGPMLSTIFAVVLLGETITLQIALGGLCIIIGVLFLTGAAGQKRNLKDRATTVAPSLMFGIAAGLLIGSYTVWDAYAVSILLVSPLLLDYASSFGRAIILAPVAARRRSQVKDLWRHHKFGVIAIAVFNPLAYILVLYALTFTPVIYVAPTREVSVLLTVLMGSLLLGEGNLRRRLSWALLILTGVSLLAIA